MACVTIFPYCTLGKTRIVLIEATITYICGGGRDISPTSVVQFSEECTPSCATNFNLTNFNKDLTFDTYTCTFIAPIETFTSAFEGCTIS